MKEARKRRGRCQAGYGFRHHPGLQSGAARGLEHSDIAEFVLLKAEELGFHGPSGVTHNSPTAMKPQVLLASGVSDQSSSQRPKVVLQIVCRGKPLGEVHRNAGFTHIAGKGDLGTTTALATIFKTNEKK